eukprot:315261_1
MRITSSWNVNQKELNPPIDVKIVQEDRDEYMIRCLSNWSLITREYIAGWEMNSVTQQATFERQHSTNIICVSRMPTGQIQPSNGGVATYLSQQINTTNGCTTHVLIPTLTLRIVLGDNTTFRTNYISHHKRTFTTFFTTQLMHNTCARTDTTFRTNYISPHKRTFTT